MAKIFLTFILFLTLTYFSSYGRDSSFYQPEFGLHIDSVNILKKFPSVNEFVEAARNKGYKILLVNVIPDKYYFNSPTLKSLGYKEGKDYLAELSKACNQYSIKLVADIQTLAWKKRGWTSDWIPGKIPSKKEVLSVVKEVSDYNIYGISEEGFLMSWILSVGSLSKDLNLVYIHKCLEFVIEEPSKYRKTIFNVLKNVDVFMSMDYYFDKVLIFSDFFSGLAAGMNKKYWMKTSPENWEGIPGNGPGSIEGMEKIIYFKAVLSQPEYIFIMLNKKKDFNRIDVSRIRERVEKFSIKSKKDYFNLVFNLSNVPDKGYDNPADGTASEFFVTSSPAILNFYASTGKKLIVTRFPVENADFFYVFTRGGYWDDLNTLEISDEIVNLLYKKNTAFFQTGGVLPNIGKNWKELKKFFNLKGYFEFYDNTNKKLFLPEYCYYGNRKYRHFIHKKWECSASGIFEKSWEKANIISWGDTSKGKIAAIIGKDNKFFINGSGIELETFSIMSNLSKLPLLNTFKGFFTFSRNVYAGFSLRRTTLEFLPKIAKTTKFKIFKITSGDRYKEDYTIIQPGENIKVKMKKWELVVIYPDRPK